MAAPVPQAAPKVHLRVGTLPYLSNTILVVAREEGLFAEQGLDVELVSQQTSTEFIPMLIKGDLDAATPALTAAFFNAVANGARLKLTLPLTVFKVQECASIGFVARKADFDAGIFANPSDWKGKRMLVSSVGTQGVPGYVIDMALRQNGLSLADLQIEKADVAAHEESLRSGQTDIVYAVEPWVTRMRQAEDLDLLLAAEQFAPGLVSSGIVFGQRLIDEPDIGKRFAVAYLKAVRQYLEGGTPRNVELTAGFTGLPESLIKQLCWSYSPPDGDFSTDSIMSYQRWLQEQGLLDRILEPEAFSDTAYAAHAAESLKKAAE